MIQSEPDAPSRRTGDAFHFEPGRNGEDLVGETTELLQALIRMQCVNDGTPEGQINYYDYILQRFAAVGS